MCILLTQNICLLCHTQVLFLNDNQIGNTGLTAFAKAVENGALPKCTFIGLDDNPASDEAEQAVHDAIANRK